MFIVHRLDRDTSGVLLFAKDEETKRAYQEHWDALVRRRGYLAVVEGRPPREEDTIRTLLRENAAHKVKTAGAMDVDALCLAGCAASVDAGFISYESQYGLAQRYRRSVQSGLVRANEHACYTVISALRAASYGIPFMPVRGLKVSDLRKVNDYFADVTDPFTGEERTFRSGAPRGFRALVC